MKQGSFLMKLSLFVKTIFVHASSYQIKKRVVATTSEEQKDDKKFL